MAHADHADVFWFVEQIQRLCKRRLAPRLVPVNRVPDGAALHGEVGSGLTG